VGKEVKERKEGQLFPIGIKLSACYQFPSLDGFQGRFKGGQVAEKGR
jgi:hypothetical protein